jgi:hypothetical protein
MPIPAKQDTEIIEPCHNALKFHTIDEKDGQGGLVFADVIEKRVL